MFLNYKCFKWQFNSSVYKLATRKTCCISLEIVCMLSLSFSLYIYMSIHLSKLASYIYIYICFYMLYIYIWAIFKKWWLSFICNSDLCIIFVTFSFIIIIIVFSWVWSVNKWMVGYVWGELEDNLQVPARSTMWVIGIEFKSSDLAARAFTRWAVIPVLYNILDDVIFVANNNLSSAPVVKWSATDPGTDTVCTIPAPVDKERRGGWYSLWGWTPQ